ncbi:Patatin [Cocos nucifera]|nr:Patatin [Cocos nucifera]
MIVAAASVLWTIRPSRKDTAGYIGAQHDGKYLHDVVRRKLGNIKLHQTLTNVVDIKRLQPTIFSSYEVKNDSSLDALLSDICIGTTAAPTYLPPCFFQTKDSDGKALVAMGEVTKEVFKGNPDFFPTKPMDYFRFLVISLGTGLSKGEERYNAKQAKSWGVLGWLLSNGSNPLVDVFMQASAEMVDIHISVAFQAMHFSRNYLRIEDDVLTGTIASVDIATKENLENLAEVGEYLLRKPVSRVNLEIGLFEPVGKGEGTNEEALIRFAKLLSEERRLREARSPYSRLTWSV